MEMEGKEFENILASFQAYARGYLLRKEINRAREDFEAIVREIDGNLTNLEWKETIVPSPHFTDTDGPLSRHTESSPSSKNVPKSDLQCHNTQPPGLSLEKTEHQLLPEKIEAERDDLHFQKQSCISRVCSPSCPARRNKHGHRDSSCSNLLDNGEGESMGSIGDSSTVWSSLEPDTSSFKGPQQSRLAQEVPRTPEALRLHRNSLAMELLWLQQAIASRKKYLSLKQTLDVS